MILPELGQRLTRIPIINARFLRSVLISVHPWLLCEEMRMMTRILMPVFCVIVAAGCAAVREPNTPQKSTKPDLVFVGTVESIEASPLPQSLANWVVTFRVDRIESGNFGGTTFSFRIHSPVKSGLEVGKQYLVEATRTDAGYTVDQYQWMNRTRNQPSGHMR